MNIWLVKIKDINWSSWKSKFEYLPLGKGFNKEFDESDK